MARTVTRLPRSRSMPSSTAARAAGGRRRRRRGRARRCRAASRTSCTASYMAGVRNPAPPSRTSFTRPILLQATHGAGRRLPVPPRRGRSDGCRATRRLPGATLRPPPKMRRSAGERAGAARRGADPRASSVAMRSKISRSVSRRWASRRSCWIRLMNGSERILVHAVFLLVIGLVTGRSLYMMRIRWCLYPTLCNAEICRYIPATLPLAHDRRRHHAPPRAHPRRARDPRPGRPLRGRADPAAEGVRAALRGHPGLLGGRRRRSGWWGAARCIRCGRTWPRSAPWRSTRRCAAAASGTGSSRAWSRPRASWASRACSC